MKPLNHFIVELPKKFKDTIEIAGKTLYLASKFDEFANRITSGKILGVPERVDTGAKIGDTIYFHHHVVMNSSLEIEKGRYIVMYDPKGAYGNHAVAYRNEEGMHMLGDWIFLREIKEKELNSEVIILMDEEKRQRRGIVAFDHPALLEMGVKVGDTVGYGASADYDMEVDGENMLRMLLQEILYVEEAS